jgi:hypothetical protein
MKDTTENPAANSDDACSERLDEAEPITIFTPRLEINYSKCGPVAVTMDDCGHEVVVGFPSREYFEAFRRELAHLSVDTTPDPSDRLGSPEDPHAFLERFFMSFNWALSGKEIDGKPVQVYRTPRGFCLQLGNRRAEFDRKGMCGHTFDDNRKEDVD